MTNLKQLLRFRFEGLGHFLLAVLLRYGIS